MWVLLPTGTVSQALDLENFATASRLYVANKNHRRLSLSSLTKLATIDSRAVTERPRLFTPVAPPGGKGEAFPVWVDVQKLCSMCVLSLSWNFFVSHDKNITRHDPL